MGVVVWPRSGGQSLRSLVPGEGLPTSVITTVSWRARAKTERRRTCDTVTHCLVPQVSTSGLQPQSWPTWPKRMQGGDRDPEAPAETPSCAWRWRPYIEPSKVCKSSYFPPPRPHSLHGRSNPEKNLGASSLGRRLPSLLTKARGRSRKSPCVAEASLQGHRRSEANRGGHKKEVDALTSVRSKFNEGGRHTH